jgi:Arc/MetJ family transcription regulator
MQTCSRFFMPMSAEGRAVLRDIVDRRIMGWIASLLDKMIDCPMDHSLAEEAVDLAWCRDRLRRRRRLHRRSVPHGRGYHGVPHRQPAASRGTPWAPVWVDVWVKDPYHWLMKMTLEVDEKKLATVMRLTGITTKTAAVDYALEKAQRAARRERLFAVRWKPEELAAAVDPSYDVLAVRHADGR